MHPPRSPSLPSPTLLATTLALLTALIAAPTLAQVSPDATITRRRVIKPETIEAFARQVMGQLQLPSVGLAVVSSRKTHLAAQLGGAGDPRQAYYLGSLSKPLSALVVMRLVERGELDLKKPARSYLKDADMLPADLSLEHLLSHRSGIPASAGHRQAHGDWRALLEGVTLGARDHYEYSNVNYVLVGAILEAVSGKTLPTIYNDELFEPLGMRDSAAPASPDEVKNLAPGHQYLFGYPLARPEGVYGEEQIPAGFLTSSPNDMALLMRALLRQGAAPREGGERFLKKLTIEQMFSLEAEQGTEGYALGWMRSTPDGKLRLSHSGLTASYQSAIIMLPKQDLGICVLVNLNSLEASAATGLARGYAASLTGGQAEQVSNVEFILRLMAGLLLLLYLLVTLYRLNAWRKRGFGLGMSNRSRLWVLINVVLTAGIWAGLPMIAGITLPALLTMQLDLGILLIAAPLLSISNAALKGWIQGSLQAKLDAEILEEDA